MLYSFFFEKKLGYWGNGFLGVGCRESLAKTLFNNTNPFFFLSFLFFTPSVVPGET